MSISEIKTRINKNLSNALGWRSSKKIIVFESDDWGSIRMPSLEILKKLQERGLQFTHGDAARYSMNDTLATEEDLNALFKVLSSFTDVAGNPCVFTAVSVVANPDFKKIADSNFKAYYYEPFTATLKKYYGHSHAYDKWLEGIDRNIFVPQFHGREHLNVCAWLTALQNADEQTRLAFEHGLWSFKNKPVKGVSISYQASFDLVSSEEIEYQKQVLETGLDLFETLFGYRATFFVPPNGPINNKLEGVAAAKGIKFMSASKIQLEALGQGKVRKRFHYLGQKNEHHQRYITRNCFFEPNDTTKDWKRSCLSDIEIAFHWKKPAVISTHRTNYIGVHNRSNRERSLSELQSLIQSIQKRWPDVEFMTSAQLGVLMENKV